jgi:hypothetical protein
MREIVSSVAKAELGALFHNGKVAWPIRTMLKEMGHPQPPAAIETDNNAAAGVANDFIKQKWSRAALINSTISTHNGHFMAIDLKGFCLSANLQTLNAHARASRAFPRSSPMISAGHNGSTNRAASASQHQVACVAFSSWRSSWLCAVWHQPAAHWGYGNAPHETHH